MSDVSSVGNDVLSQFGPKPRETDNRNELGKNEFLELMIAQMNNQSPLDPQSNEEFVAQLAQFSSVESLENLNITADSMASQLRSSQALQASAMVGRDVMVLGDSTLVAGEGGLNTIVDLPGATSNVKMSIYNASGALVFEEQLGQQSGGDLNYNWPGTTVSGEPLPAGRYRVAAEARYDGQMQQVNTYVSANVDSVSIASDGQVTLNLAGMGSVGISEVKEIQ